MVKKTISEIPAATEPEKKAGPGFLFVVIFGALFSAGSFWFKAKPGILPLLVMAAAFIVLGIYFFRYSRNETDVFYVAGYVRQSKRLLFGKLIVVIALLGIALYFEKLRIFQLSQLAYIAAVIQSLLFFRLESNRYEMIASEKQEQASGSGAQSGIYLMIMLMLSLVALFAFSARSLFFPVIIITGCMLVMQNYFNSNDFKEPDSEEKLTALDITFLVLILINGSLLRFMSIENVPPGYSQEARTYFSLMTQIRQGIEVAFFYPGMDLTSFYLKLCTAFTSLAGNNMLSIRLFSAVLSVLTLAGFFLLIRELYGKKIALFSSASFAFMFLNVTFSRLDNPVYTAVFGLVFGAYFIVKGVKTGRMAFYILAGVMTAFNAYIYGPAKLQILILLSFFGIFTAGTAGVKQGSGRTKGLFVFVTAVLIVLMPLLSYVKANFNAYMTRPAQMLPQIQDRVRTIAANFSDIAFALTAKGSEQAVANLPLRPVLTWPEGILFILGLAYVAAFIKKRNNLAVLTWALIGIIPGLVFVAAIKPMYYRFILALPVLSLLVGLGAYVLYKMLSKVPVKAAKYSYAAVFAVLFLFSFITTSVDYFVKYPADQKTLDACGKAGMEVENIIKKYSKNNKVIVSCFYPGISSTFCIDCFPAGSYKTTNFADLGISDLYDSRGTILIGEGMHADYISSLLKYFPGAELKIEKNAGEVKNWADPIKTDIVYASIKIPATDIKETYGLYAEYTGVSGTVKTKTGPGLELPPDMTDNTVKLSGLIDIPVNDIVKIDFKDAAADIRIDGRPMDKTKYYKGLHKFQAVVKLTKGKKPVMRWALGSKEAAVVPAGSFLAKEELQGLLYRYSYNFNKENVTLLQPSSSVRFYQFRLPRQTDMQNAPLEIVFFDLYIKGYYYAETDGEYMFDIVSPDQFCNTILVNKMKVYTRHPDDVQYKIALKKGWHPIEVISYSEVQDTLGMIYELRAKKLEDADFVPVPYKNIRPFND